LRTVIDGYNLFHFALKAADPPGSLALSAFVEAIGEYARWTRAEVLLVFDGGVPPALHGRSLNLPGLAVRFSGPGRSADDLILHFLEGYSGVRHLCVVSTDRAIRAAARRRSCKHILTAADFWGELVTALARTPRKRPEPAAKRSGLSSEETDYWLREFGIQG